MLEGYTLPGLFLLFVMGLAPLLTAVNGFLIVLLVSAPGMRRCYSRWAHGNPKQRGAA